MPTTPGPLLVTTGSVFSLAEAGINLGAGACAGTSATAGAGGASTRFTCSTETRALSPFRNRAASGSWTLTRNWLARAAQRSGGHVPSSSLSQSRRVWHAVCRAVGSLKLRANSGRFSSRLLENTDSSLSPRLAALGSGQALTVQARLRTTRNDKIEGVTGAAEAAPLQGSSLKRVLSNPLVACAMGAQRCTANCPLQSRRTACRLPRSSRERHRPRRPSGNAIAAYLKQHRAQ